MPTRAKTFRERAIDAGAVQVETPRIQRGYGRPWERLRTAVLRGEPLCRLCRRPAVLVDHIRPISAGGARLDNSNLRPLCRACHDAVTANYRKTGVNEPVGG